MLIAPGRLLVRAGLPVPSLDLNFRAGAMPGGLTFTRASTAWAYNSSGVLTSFATNEPRLDHDPATLAPRGLLVEEARTNLFLNSATGATQSVTVTAAAHTLSFFGTGTITLTGASTAGPLVGTGANNRVSLTFTPTAGSLTLTVSGSCTNVQLELGTFATSPIVTTAAAVTRAADSCTMPVGSWYSATEGTLYAEATAPAGGSGQRVVALDDGTSGEQIYLNRAPSYNGLVRDASVNQANIATTTWADAATARLALAWKSNDVAFSAAGSAAVTDTSATIPTVNMLRIGTQSAGANPFNGWVRTLRYYPRRLPDATLQAITS